VGVAVADGAEDDAGVLADAAGGPGDVGLDEVVTVVHAAIPRRAALRVAVSTGFMAHLPLIGLFCHVLPT
jgi:hypothetical protein